MRIGTDIGTTTLDRIDVRGKDLATDIIGKFDFVDMICWLLWERLPDERERDMLDMFLVTSADHGLTPSAISARLTYLGAPESLQGAVAAGLLGAGNNFLGTVQNASECFRTFAAKLPATPDDMELAQAARHLVDHHRDKRITIPGVGHPIHVNGDPRVPAILEVAKRNGYAGRHWGLALALPDALAAATGRRLPLNAAGAVGAALADMDLPPEFGRGLALIGRTAGLLAHLAEERRKPVGQEIWNLVLRQDERNTLPGDTR